MEYAEQIKAAAEKFRHCRMAGGLDDEDIARQLLAAAGITEPESSGTTDPAPEPEPGHDEEPAHEEETEHPEEPTEIPPPPEARHARSSRHAR